MQGGVGVVYLVLTHSMIIFCKFLYETPLGHITELGYTKRMIIIITVTIIIANIFHGFVFGVLFNNW